MNSHIFVFFNALFIKSSDYFPHDQFFIKKWHTSRQSVTHFYTYNLIDSILFFLHHIRRVLTLSLSRPASICFATFISALFIIDFGTHEILVGWFLQDDVTPNVIRRVVCSRPGNKKQASIIDNIPAEYFRIISNIYYEMTDILD